MPVECSTGQANRVQGEGGSESIDGGRADGFRLGLRDVPGSSDAMTHADMQSTHERTEDATFSLARACL